MNKNIGSKTLGMALGLPLVVLLSMYPSGRANAQVSALAAIPLTQSTNLGQGYAVGVGSMRALALEQSPVLTLESNRVEYDLKYIDDYNELSKVLNISAAASYGAGGVGGNVRANLMRSSTLSRRNAYVVVRALVEIRSESISSYQLKPAALTAAKKGARDFFEGYGDSFIRGISYGGELAALLEFASTTTTDAQQLRLDVRAAVGDLGGSASYEESIRTLTHGRKVTVRYVQSGGDTGQVASLAASHAPANAAAESPTGVVVLTPEQLIRRLNEFIPEVRRFPTQAKPLIGELMDYAVVSTWPEETAKPVPSPDNGRLTAAVATLRMIEEELATVSDGMAANNYQAAAALNEGLMLRNYLEYSRQVADTVVRQVASSPQDTTNWQMLSLDQYSDEVTLSMPSSVWRGNAGAQCSVLESDIARLRECLLGPRGGWKFERWPTVKSFSVERGVTTEFMRVRENNIVKNGQLNWAGVLHHSPRTPIQAFADQICGKTGPDDGRLALWSTTANTSFGDGCCGVSASNFACVEFERPAEIAFPRSTYVQKEGTTLEGPTRFAAGNGKKFLEFDVKPVCAKGFGAYVLLLQPSEGFPKKERGYYRFSDGELQTLRHPISEDDGTQDSSKAAVMLEQVYCAV